MSYKVTNDDFEAMRDRLAVKMAELLMTDLEWDQVPDWRQQDYLYAAEKIVTDGF